MWKSKIANSKYLNTLNFIKQQTNSIIAIITKEVRMKRFALAIIIAGIAMAVYIAVDLGLKSPEGWVKLLIFTMMIVTVTLVARDLISRL